ncbi:hypothetical protein GOHSU_04_01180 [Gordonia hirsuta DSM 44140 = NBRC 16056]|uniref:CsbD-like domain-containing protein n=1 Tax=Gordonia hirsuta DSM 44140 = NBRC 16056 TaxID=1121927 RepID=L7L5N0_9ACTN|nr:hypothetical protein [Gordonia hirsuta]GAC56249.1 hypothetical protein GOHSU_04_01180 [Gordonia hirsuta DSM 44140 = NBRC 16056]
MSFTDKAKNKAEDLKGRATEAAGALTGDEELKEKGEQEQVLAEANEIVTDAADKVKGGVDALKDKLTGR